MSPPDRWRILLVACTTLSTLLAGCDSMVPTSAPVAGYPEVNGIVQAAGDPVAGARVVFIPQHLVNEQGWEIPYAHGMTDEKGNFVLHTETGKKGCPLGWHDVWVIELDSLTQPDTPPTDSDTPLRYSRHQIEVTSEQPTPITIDHTQGLRFQGDMPPPEWALRKQDPPASNAQAQENPSRS